jgi:hypothetical protein
MSYHAFGDRCARAVGGRWRRGVVAGAALVALAVAGCSGSSSGGASGPVSPQGGASGSGGLGGSSGLVTPGGASGAGGLVKPGPGTGPATAGEAEGVGARSGVTGGALFGGSLPLVPQTGRLGRRLAIVRMYFRIGQQFPSPAAKGVLRAGSTVLASLDSVPGEGQGSYASIISGQHDAAIKRFLQQVEQAAVGYHLGAIYFCFEHEANTRPHQALGTPAQFVQAWDHVHALAESAHLLWNQGGRVHFVLILTHLAYFSQGARPRWSAGMGQATSYFPGKNEVDIVAADGYNHGGCKHLGPAARAGVPAGSRKVTPGYLFDGVVSFARSQGGLPVFIAEWGSQAFAGSSEQSVFIGQMRAFVPANREIAAAMYWNSHSPQNHGCSSSLDNQPASLAALAAMGHSAGLQGHLVSPPR